MRRRYPTRQQIREAVEAARELGLLPRTGPASIELAPDGTIRLSPPPVAAPRDAFEEWQDRL